MKGDREHWVTPVAVLPVLTVPHSRTGGEEEATGSSRVGGEARRRNVSIDVSKAIPRAPSCVYFIFNGAGPK